MLGPGDFLGEGCLAAQPLRMGTANAVMPTALLRVPKRDMIRMLHEHPEFSDRFLAHMLTRNIRIEEDLIDQLFNSSEKRLARTLLLLARYGKEETPRVLPKLSQETARTYCFLDLQARARVIWPKRSGAPPFCRAIASSTVKRTRSSKNWPMRRSPGRARITSPSSRPCRC